MRNFLSKNKLDKAQKKFNKDLSKLSKERQAEVQYTSSLVDREIDRVNSEMDERNMIDNKFRAAGFKPSEAEDVLYAAKLKKVGEIFYYRNKFLVKTPYNTVVDAQLYINTLQNQLIGVAELNSAVTTGSFFDLIKIAFKRLFKKGYHE